MKMLFLNNRNQLLTLVSLFKMSCLSNTYVHIIIKTVFEKDHFFVILGEKLKKKNSHDCVKEMFKK